MAKPILNIWGENASIPPLTPSQQAQGYAYTAAKPGQLAGTVDTGDLDYPMQQVTLAVAFVLDRMGVNGHINGMEWISGQSYVVGNIVVGHDGNQYYCNTANSSQNPVSDGTDKWRQYPSKITTGAGGEIIEKHFNSLMTISSNVINFGTYSAPSLAYKGVTFPSAFASNPNVITNLNAGNGTGGLTTFSAESVTATSFRFTYSGGLNSSPIFSYIAHGRWA